VTEPGYGAEPHLRMLLAIDVGNTNIVLGVFDGAKLTQSWRLATMRERTADEIGILVTHLFQDRHVDMKAVDGIVIASVVPPLTSVVVEMAEQYFGRTPVVVEASLDLGMPIRYENPEEVGADRIVNGLAAFEFYGRKTSQPVIVVDFGTATTFDAISAQGEYLGGIICPGVQISADALFQRAARLPRVDVRRPASLIGRTTVGSMQSGLYFGYVAMVEGIVQRLRRELDDAGRARRSICVGTGGLAETIAAETPAIEHVDRDLTLQGLRIVWERNRKQPGT
jgi:type III pantothenate kinase